MFRHVETLSTRHARPRSQACADRINLAEVPGIHAFAAAQDVDGRDNQCVHARLPTGYGQAMTVD